MLYHQQTKGNEVKRGSRLAPPLPSPSSAGSSTSSVIMYENWAGVDMMYAPWMVDGGVNRRCILASRKTW